MKTLIFAALLVASGAAVAGDKTDAAIGGGVGGALGAVIGDELGGRDGAIIGAGVGGAVGAALATDNDKDRKVVTEPHHAETHVEVVEVRTVTGGHPHGRHCPPGQHKKGRC